MDAAITEDLVFVPHGARQVEPGATGMRLVVTASSAGTIFEWYDFFIYGTLASIVGKTFFPAGNPTLQVLLVWAGFAAGFGFRPLGAILFGYLGDRFGRKYTFLATVTLMGIATAGMGVIPSAASIGIAAPIIVVSLRILQGLAVGGEFGGALIYVAEHSPVHKRGSFTSIIQAAGLGGFVLSLVVVLACKAVMPDVTWAGWGWRVPFLLSFGLLGVSLWMRLKLSESPVFQAMKEEGRLAKNPFVESFTYPGNGKRLFIALFGIAAGMNVIIYTAGFFSLNFLKSTMRMSDTAAEIIVGVSAVVGIAFYILFGRLSDRIGRKPLIVWGYALTLVLLFPIFWTIGSYANPGMAEAARKAPIVVTGPDCSYSPFSSEQPTRCGKMLADLSGSGVAFKHVQGADLVVSVGGKPIPLDSYNWYDRTARGQQLQAWLRNAGYHLAKVKPSLKNSLAIIAAMLLLFALVGAIFGPVAALLTEMFPARIRYSSLSIPYHIGAGYFGGFLPLIAAYIVARTGDPYAGLWYTWIVVALALPVALWGLESGVARPDVGGETANRRPNLDPSPSLS
ncbi:MAG: MFS transporter [Novosphingobium sp.]|nr:MFS transporter [Novosphingobium sp.]